MKSGRWKTDMVKRRKRTMLDVVYCGGCKLVRECEYAIDKEDCEDLFNLKCNYCSTTSDQFIVYFDEDGTPTLLESVCGEDLMNYDTDFLIENNKEELDKKSRILKEGIKFSKRLTKEQEIKAAEEKIVEDAKRLTDNLQERERLSAEIPGLDRDQNYNERLAWFFDNCAILKKPLLGKANYRVEKKTIDDLKNSSLADKDKLERYKSRLIELNSEIEKCLREEESGKKK